MSYTVNLQGLFVEAVALEVLTTSAEKSDEIDDEFRSVGYRVSRAYIELTTLRLRRSNSTVRVSTFRVKAAAASVISATGTKKLRFNTSDLARVLEAVSSASGFCIINTPFVGPVYETRWQFGWIIDRAE
ncbi:MAG: hypothetical protein AAF967_06815 [Pseudomonadota bacterium]